jgi:hypothetical protein
MYWLDRLDKKSDKTEQNITTHSSTLIQEFKQQRDIFSPHDNGWNKFLKKFQYGIEFKEHLSTGHPELYSELESLIEVEEKSDIQKQFYDKILNKVRIDCQKMGIGYSNNNPPPWFDQRGLVKSIFNNIDMNNLKLLQLVEGGFPKAWSIIYNNEGYRLNEMDKELSDKLVTHLNSILLNKELQKEFKDYQLVRDELIPLRMEFEADLDNLLKGIGLSAGELKGACDYCLDWYDGKTKKNFQAKLSKFTKQSD